MLSLVENLPAGVVGVETHGVITASDYTEVLAPAVAAARAASPDGKVRLLVVLGHDLPDVTVGAAWQDAKLGLGELRSWERIAVVTDATWVRRALGGLAWALPGEVRVYGTAERAVATEWLVA